LITQAEAIEIARAYAEESRRGWDEHAHHATVISLYGEPVWMIATTDVEHSTELPWLMTHLPNPRYYYISMVEAKCIAVGHRVNQYQRVR